MLFGTADSGTPWTPYETKTNWSRCGIPAMRLGSFGRERGRRAADRPCRMLGHGPRHELF